VTRRFVAHAERRHGEQPLEVLAAVVGRRIDPADGCQLPQPEVALLLARAQEEVASA
jgi:hypothetical protein